VADQLWLMTRIREEMGDLPLTASACTVCRCKTIFALVGPTKLLKQCQENVNSKKSDSY